MLKADLLINNVDTPAASGQTYARKNPMTAEVATRKAAAASAPPTPPPPPTPRRPRFPRGRRWARRSGGRGCSRQPTCCSHASTTR